MKHLSFFPKIIKTNRLELKTIDANEQNAKVLLDIINANRDYLEAWQGHFGELHTIESVIKKLEHRNHQTENDEGVLFGIYKDNNLIGRIRFFNIKDKGCEIGYWLIKSANGFGFMSEALSGLETELFKFGFDKIILEIDDGNVPSTNLAKRNNYKLNQVLPMAGYAKCVGKCDCFVYIKEK